METHNYTINGGLPASSEIGLNGLTDTTTKILPGAEIKSFIPKNANNFQSSILIPGFGHMSGTVANTFKELGQKLAELTNIATYLTVDDQQDYGSMLFWTSNPTSVSMAIESAINISRKAAHIIAFSRHAEPAINAVASMLYHQEGMLNEKFYTDWKKHKKDYGPVLSLTLCAPAFWNNLRDLMEKRDSYHESEDSLGKFVKIGKRGIKASFQNSSFKDWQPDSDDLIKFKKLGDLFVDRGVKCKVLIAQSDPIVPNELSIKVSEAFGFEYQIIKPETSIGNIHDFDDQNLRTTIANTITNNLISTHRSFDILPELQKVTSD